MAKKGTSNFLVIDDSRISRCILDKTIHRCLEGREIVVHQAATIAEAKDLLAKYNILIIFLDQYLTNENGFNFLKDIREEKNPTPVIIVSAEDEPETIEKSIELGANDYIVKPLLLDKVKASIKKLLRHTV